MEAYLSIVSLRTVREYSERPVSDESALRILQAGRASGSSRNKQPWTFYVARAASLRSRLAEGVFAPENVTGCQVAVVVGMASKGGFDAGRVAQNMMLAAWAEGIGSAPNGIRDADIIAEVLGLETPNESITTVLIFGYPGRPYRQSSDVEGILQRIDRKPLEELAVWLE